MESVARENARMFVLLDEWARLHNDVEDGKLTKQEAFDRFNSFALKFGRELFFKMIADTAIMSHVDDLKNLYGGTKN